MPSYEDMIVEALLEAENAPPDENGQRPDGLAPKDVYAWMAAHYSLQSNFRPSASQALQKAYKRGRLEKGAGGKYKVNHNAGASSLPVSASFTWLYAPIRLYAPGICTSYSRPSPR